MILDYAQQVQTCLRSIIYIQSVLMNSKSVIKRQECKHAKLSRKSSKFSDTVDIPVNE